MNEQLPSETVSTTKIVMKVGDTDTPTKPQQVKCADCNHVWVGFYLPQPIMTAAKIAKNLTCPMCGAGSDRVMMHI